MRLANPHTLWLLVAVPAAVIAYALGFASRRRRLARLGDAVLVAKMTADVSVARKVTRIAAGRHARRVEAAFPDCSRCGQAGFMRTGTG